MSAFRGVKHATAGNRRPLHGTCPLLGVKRTSLVALHMAAGDPKLVGLAAADKNDSNGHKASSEIRR
jgi:hypothetical protein